MRAYPRSWLRKVLGVLRKVLLALLPENRFGDTVFSWVSFVFYHRRLPDRNRMWFNNFLYAIKVSDEILDPLRVLTTDKMLRTPNWKLMEHNPTWCLLLVQFGGMWLVAFPKTKARRKGASGG
jgi:hypothetical protein